MRDLRLLIVYAPGDVRNDAEPKSVRRKYVALSVGARSFCGGAEVTCMKSHVASYSVARFYISSISTFQLGVSDSIPELHLPCTQVDSLQLALESDSKLHINASSLKP